MPADETTTTARPERMFRVLGTTEDAPTAGCQHCGKADLRTYVALEPTAGGPIVYYGTTCAARAERLPVAEIRGEAKAADKAAREAAAAARNAANNARREAYHAWIAERYGVATPGDLRDIGLRPLDVHSEWLREVEAAAEIPA